MVLDATATETVATALQTAINTDTMMSNLATFVPVIGGVIIFAFTYRVIRRVVSGAPRGKAKI